LAIIVKKLLNIFAALPNCQSTGGVSIEMAKPIPSLSVYFPDYMIDLPTYFIELAFIYQ
jgi:hypothetical protein